MHIQIDLRNRDKAIKRIDSAIKLLEDTKEDLIKMDKHMDAAKKKAEKVTIQKLRKMHTVVIADTETVLSDDQDAIAVPGTNVGTNVVKKKRIITKPS